MSTQHFLGRRNLSLAAKLIWHHFAFPPNVKCVQFYDVTKFHFSQKSQFVTWSQIPTENTTESYYKRMVAAIPTILRPRVRIPSTPSTLFQFVLLKFYRENNENKQKEAGIGPFLKKRRVLT